MSDTQAGNVLIAGNKLIAEFMGFTFRDSAMKGEFICDVPADIDWAYHSRCIYAVTIKFHESFDWLMPVVKKLNEVLDPVCTPMFTSEAGSYLRSLHNAITDIDITASFNLAVLAIQWYNTQPKTNTHVKEA